MGEAGALAPNDRGQTFGRSTTRSLLLERLGRLLGGLCEPLAFFHQAPVNESENPTMDLLLRRVPFVLLTALAWVVPAQAADFIVDVNNGPGTDFTEIQAAIDAASPDDSLLVREGSYRSFTLNKGLTIRRLGEGLVIIGPDLTNIRQIPQGQIVVLEDLFFSKMRLERSKGLIYANKTFSGPGTEPGGETYTVAIESCHDVRLRQFAINATTSRARDGIRVTDSRLTIDGGPIDGSWGARGNAASPDGENGGIGLIAERGSIVHASFCRIFGGNGGSAFFDPGAGNVGGSGGLAALVTSYSRVEYNGIIETQARGGFGAIGGDGVPHCPLWGMPASAFHVESTGHVRVGGFVRVDGATSHCFPDAPPFSGPGTIEVVDPPDLAMAVTEALPPFVLAKIQVVGTPGSDVRLLAGVEPIIQDIPTILGQPLMVEPLEKIPLGIIPSSGVLEVTPDLIPSFPGARVILLQTYARHPNGSVSLSNSTGLTP